MSPFEAFLRRPLFSGLTPDLDQPPETRRQPEPARARTSITAQPRWHDLLELTLHPDFLARCLADELPTDRRLRLMEPDR